MTQTLSIAGGGHILTSKAMLGKELKDASDDEIRSEREKFLAMCFVLRSNEVTYKKLLDDLKRSANLGRDEYPETLTAAFDLLVRESGEYDGTRRFFDMQERGGRGGRGRNGFNFAQQGRGGDFRNSTYTRNNNSNSNEIVQGTDGELHPDVKCFGCNFSGHYRNKCPYVTQSGAISMHVGVVFANPGTFTIPDHWLLLDTCSTCNVAKNPDIVSKIRECIPGERLTAYCNGGKQLYNLVANLNVLPIEVHFKKNSMVNIVGMKLVSEIEGVCVTMDTKHDLGISVTLENGDFFTFEPYENGLYYLDLDKLVSSSKTKSTVTNYSLLKTVKENKSYFTAQEIKGADMSREIQQYLHYPSTKTLKIYVNNNLITNCKITTDDINRAEIIYGPAVTYTQGHMTR